MATTLINNINLIIINYYDYNDSYQFYNNLCKIDDDIRSHISDRLYKEYKTEHLCIYYELIYDGNEDDTDIIVRDCITILQRIISKIK